MSYVSNKIIFFKGILNFKSNLCNTRSREFKIENISFRKVSYFDCMMDDSSFSRFRKLIVTKRTKQQELKIKLKLISLYSQKYYLCSNCAKKNERKKK